MRKLLKHFYSSFRRYIYSKQNIIIERNVNFNKTCFSEFNRVCNNTNVSYTSIGTNTYIGWNSVLKNSSIGSYCSIAPYVEVFYGNHPTNFVSTSPVFFSKRKQTGYTFVDKPQFEEFNYADKEKKRSVIIGNDVWIGYGVKIKEGITIGDGAIVAAGALVNNDIAPYSIVGGVPAKLIKYRFNKDEIDLLLKFRWWDKSQDWLKSNCNLFLNKNDFFRFISDYRKIE